MIKWTKLPYPDCLTQDPTLVYVIPCEEGSQILYKGEICTIEGESVVDIVDKFNAIGCTSFQLTKEELEKTIEEKQK